MRSLLLLAFLLFCGCEYMNRNDQHCVDRCAEATHSFVTIRESKIICTCVKGEAVQPVPVAPLPAEAGGRS